MSKYGLIIIGVSIILATILAQMLPRYEYHIVDDDGKVVRVDKWGGDACWVDTNFRTISCGKLRRE